MQEPRSGVAHIAMQGLWLLSTLTLASVGGALAALAVALPIALVVLVVLSNASSVMDALVAAGIGVVAVVGVGLYVYGRIAYSRIRDCASGAERTAMLVIAVAVPVIALVVLWPR